MSAQGGSRGHHDGSEWRSVWMIHHQKMRDVWQESNPWAKYHWLRNPWTKYQSVEEMRKDAEKIKLQLGSEVAFNLAKGWDPLPRQFISDYKDDGLREL